MLIVEIILTVFAWRKGWKAWALLPVGIALAIGLLIGFSVGASGGNAESVRGIGIFLDIVAIGVLIYMTAKGPKVQPIDSGTGTGGTDVTPGNTDTTVDGTTK
jgi:hypothetical protein